MNSENITIENVLEIFSDFLDQSNDFEVVETKKMGVLTILDGSESKDRSELSIERVRDAENLARQLLWFGFCGLKYPAISMPRTSTRQIPGKAMKLCRTM